MLASWNEGAAKSAITDFVARVTKEGGRDHVPPAERIATFDNDGTLWCEQPMQVQVFFAQARPKELAKKDPSIDERQPFKAFLEHDVRRSIPILAFGNSDGDLAMLRYVKTGPGARLALLVHHDDAEREFAYDREFRLSPLVEALDKAAEYGITLVSTKRDWKTVFRDAAGRTHELLQLPSGT